MSILTLGKEKIEEGFYFGNLGGFDLKIIIDKSTGFFNASHLCKIYGKDLRSWFELESTKSLVLYFHELNLSKGVKYSVKDRETQIVNGIYFYQGLLSSLACWLDVNLYVKINEVLLRYCSKIQRSSDMIERRKELVKKLPKEFDYYDRRNFFM